MIDDGAFHRLLPSAARRSPLPEQLVDGLSRSVALGLVCSTGPGKNIGVRLISSKTSGTIRCYWRTLSHWGGSKGGLLSSRRCGLCPGSPSGEWLWEARHPGHGGAGVYRWRMTNGPQTPEVLF